jgi:hypothetical protein
MTITVKADTREEIVSRLLAAANLIREGVDDHQEGNEEDGLYQFSVETPAEQG